MYDELDRVSSIYQRISANSTETLAYRFVYNNEGDLYELRNYKTLRATFFEYDHGGRCVASREKSFTVSGSSVTYGTMVSGYRYEYDANNNLSKLSCSQNGTTWSTVYTYDGDNRPKTTTLSNGKLITNTYDAIGRLTQKRIGLSSNYDTTLTYMDGANGSKTALLSTYKNGTDGAYSYTYDDNGNITSITQGTATTTYTYDTANQLVREDIYLSSGNTGNKNKM